MSSRIRFTLIAGIDTLRVHEGKIIDPRYQPRTEVGRLEEATWQRKLIPLPELPARFEDVWISQLPQDDQWEYDRLNTLYQHLTDPRAMRDNIPRQAYELLYWSPDDYAHLLGFIVQRAPDIDLIGFALAEIEEHFASSGYHTLPVYQGTYAPVSHFLHPSLQRMQQTHWNYPNFVHLMPGYFQVFAYLCDWIGFHLAPQDIDQIKLMLHWQWR